MACLASHRGWRQPVHSAELTPPMISDDDVVYRRVPSAASTIDQATGEQRPTSDCFSDSTRHGTSPMSCILASALVGRDLASLVPGPGGDRLVALRVGDIRLLGLDVEASPAADEPAHVSVIGEKTRSVRRRLADLAQYVV